MQDFINVDYLEAAFPNGQVELSTYTRGDTPDNSRLNIRVINGDVSYTYNFQRTLLVNALSDEGLQNFVIDVFKARLS